MQGKDRGIPTSDMPLCVRMNLHISSSAAGFIQTQRETEGEGEGEEEKNGEIAPREPSLERSSLLDHYLRASCFLALAVVVPKALGFRL